MPPPRHPSGESPDPALILAIRQEIDQALQPVSVKIDAINSRLATGDTALALLKQEIATHVAREPGTGRTEKKKEMNPILLALISGAVGSVGSVAAVWLLVGLGQQAAKGAP